MKPAELRIQLRAALSDCKKYRGDSQEHLKACFAEVMEKPEREWLWWIEYFKAEAALHHTPHGPTAKPAPIASETWRQRIITDAARYAAPEA